MDIGDETYDPARDDRTRFDGPWYRLFEEPGQAHRAATLAAVAAEQATRTPGKLYRYGVAFAPPD